MSRRRYLLFHAWAYTGIAMFIALLPLATRVDTLGYCFAFGFSVLLAFKAYKSFKALKEVKDEERVYTPDENATTPEKISFYKRFMRLSAIAFPVLTVITGLELSGLSSDSTRASVWAPVAWVYNMFGYWPAMLFVPLLGAFCIIGFMIKIAKLKKEGEDNIV